MATLEQLIIFFLLIGVGVIARKVGVITPGNTPQLTSLVFNFAMPAIYFRKRSFHRTYIRIHYAYFTDYLQSYAGKNFTL